MFLFIQNGHSIHFKLLAPTDQDLNQLKNHWIFIITTSVAAAINMCGSDNCGSSQTGFPRWTINMMLIRTRPWFIRNSDVTRRLVASVYMPRKMWTRIFLYSVVDYYNGWWMALRLCCSSLCGLYYAYEYCIIPSDTHLHRWYYKKKSRNYVQLYRPNSTGFEIFKSIEFQAVLYYSIILSRIWQISITFWIKKKKRLGTISY